MPKSATHVRFAVVGDIHVNKDSVGTLRAFFAQASEAAVVAPASKARFGQLAQSVRVQLGVAETLPRAPLLGE